MDRIDEIKRAEELGKKRVQNANARKSEIIAEAQKEAANILGSAVAEAQAKASSMLKAIEEEMAKERARRIEIAKKKAKKISKAKLSKSAMLHIAKEVSEKILSD
ncbi:MAG: hypothetical protein QXT43_01185 [Candidatus Micrarchaeaceae archaeon]